MAFLAVGIYFVRNLRCAKNSQLYSVLWLDYISIISMHGIWCDNIEHQLAVETTAYQQKETICDHK